MGDDLKLTAEERALILQRRDKAARAAAYDRARDDAVRLALCWKESDGDMHEYANRLKTLRNPWIEQHNAEGGR